MKKLLPFLLFTCCSCAVAQDTVRVCTYNVLNYSVTNEDGRAARFERILKEIKPDLFIVQEMIDSVSSRTLGKAFGNAMVETGHGGASWMNFHDGNETDNMLYYNHGKFEPVNAVYYQTELRDIAHYTVALKNTNDTIHIFSVHLKAGDTEIDAIQRTNEIMTLKNNMPMGDTDNVIVAGDFNFYSTDEVAYSMLTNTPFQRLVDPMGLTWVRNSTQYLNFYTQSPRIEPNAGCGGGTGGGMDDRFDFILHSEALADNFKSGSYTVFGNDGADRRNSPINEPVNTKVDSIIAADLFCASDHLPVYADFIFGAPTSVATPGFIQEITFKETAEYVNVFLPSSGSITVTNLLGQTLELLNDDGGNQFIQKARFAPGVYFIQATAKADAGSVAGWYKFVVVD